MNLLLLHALACSLESELPGAALDVFRQESAHRFRLGFDAPGGRRGLIVSLLPGRPWVGRPRGSWPGPRWSQPPLHRHVDDWIGLRVERLERRRGDRWLALSLAGGARIVLELVSQRPNLILLDPQGRVVDAARRPRSDRERLAEGEPYRARQLPPGSLEPFGASPERLAEAIAEGRPDDARPPRPLRSLGDEAWALLRREAGDGVAARAALLAERLRALEAGESVPVLDAADDPMALAERGVLDGEAAKLWPWEPSQPPCEGRQRFFGAAHDLIGSLHEAQDRAELWGGRHRGLLSLLADEQRRSLAAASRAADDAESFEEPERWRRLGEALLAGLSVARSEGGHLVVPDPWHGGELEIELEPGLAPARMADRLFERYRRAERGRERGLARERAQRSRAARLETLREAHGRTALSVSSIDVLESAMRAEGIAVGLASTTRRGRERARAMPVRPVGIRLFTSRDGLEILVGRGARENDRLTFKIASPEDFWFHVRDATGAHVVVRSPGRGALPPGTVVEAAALAARYSELREESHVDVQWTRRKHVRRVRKGPAGRVVVKRSETVRVSPSQAPSQQEGGD